VIDRAMPVRDESGRFVPQEKPVKPVLNKPVVVKVDQTTAGPADDAGAGAGDGKPDSKVRDLLGDIKDKIGGGVDLSGGEEVDPNIKAAQEIAGVDRETA
jgi:hypothetical protein